MPYYEWDFRYWTQGNLNPVSAFATDTLTVDRTFTLSDGGVQQENDGSHPRFREGGVAADVLTAAGYNTPSVSGVAEYDDCSVNHLEVHFGTTDVRDAYTAALSAASTQAAVDAVVKNYRDHAVGGYWGTLGVAP